MKAEKIYDYLNELQIKGEIQNWFREICSCGVKGFRCHEYMFTIGFVDRSFEWFAESDVANTNDIDHIISAHSKYSGVDDVLTFPTGDN